MRTKRLLLNSVTSLILRLVTVVCGFIMGRVILLAYGSEINGAVSSIGQFLGYISLLEAGVGGVTRAALYKPLADNDINKISGIANATYAFFRKLALVFVAYTIGLSVLFKAISGTQLNWGFVAGLVIILSINTFSQYYFGIISSILLNADQREYINNTIHAISIIVNLVVCILLIKAGCSIHIVKIASVGIYAIKPVLLFVVTKKLYGIDRTVAPDMNSIKQRWNGFGHHIAFYIHNNVDVMVITIFLGLKWASVYAVYHTIVYGIRQVVNCLTGSSEAAMGNMIAKNENDILRSRFRMIETLSSMVIISIFSVTGLLILDFIKIYTGGINDANYVVASVAILFVISEALHCIKQNYHNVVLAAGHYKETQLGAFIEAGINVVLSVALVNLFGITGVLVATIVSTLYRTIDYIIYLQKNILQRSIFVFLKRMAVNLLNAICVLLVCKIIHFNIPSNYFEWIIKAIPVFILSVVITGAINLLFYFEDIKAIVAQILGIYKKGRRKK